MCKKKREIEEKARKNIKKPTATKSVVVWLFFVTVVTFRPEFKGRMEVDFSVLFLSISNN
jgi:hypothetical protein